MTGPRSTTATMGLPTPGNVGLQVTWYLATRSRPAFTAPVNDTRVTPLPFLSTVSGMNTAFASVTGDATPAGGYVPTALSCTGTAGAPGITIARVIGESVFVAASHAISAVSLARTVTRCPSWTGHTWSETSLNPPERHHHLP